MHCYVCDNDQFIARKGSVRDAPQLKIRECTNCGMVSLESTDHIKAGHYENSGMHSGDLPSIESWLQRTSTDDARRYDMLQSILPGKSVLDFGCGAAGFLLRAKNLAKEVAGIELEQRVRDHWAGQLSIHADMELAGENFDLITAFHVVEHLEDPRTILKALGKKLSKNGRMIVEVPSADDALLTFYDCDAFQNFTYWSQHLYLLNPSNLKLLAAQAGLKVVATQYYQRYPLSNHLHWLSKGKPGGHEKWHFLDSPELSSAYGNALASIGASDTLIAYLEIADNK
jgi:SAM-dependent methyltransferase